MSPSCPTSLRSQLRPTACPLARPNIHSLLIPAPLLPLTRTPPPAQVVLVEEAAEVFEAHVLACLSRSVEHLVLVGDHEQLRPKANVYELQAVSRRCCAFVSGGL